MNISKIVIGQVCYDVKDSVARAAIGDINAILDRINGEVV